MLPRLLALLAIVSFAPTALQQREEHAQRSIEARLGHVSATVRLRPYQKSDGEGWWGVDASEPRVICASVLIKVGRETVQVPRSAYGDLANVTRAVVTAHGQTIKLTLTGGDAAGSFRCTIVVERHRVVRRRVEDGEFPQNFFETTNYVDIPVRD